jgi:hypothetical protein
MDNQIKLAFCSRSYVRRCDYNCSGLADLLQPFSNPPTADHVYVRQRAACNETVRFHLQYKPDHHQSLEL